MAHYIVLNTAASLFWNSARWRFTFCREHNKVIKFVFVMTKTPLKVYRDLIYTVKQSLNEARLLCGLAPEQVMTIVLAVSGGEDSVVLLDVMSKWKSGFNIDFIVAHVNHGFRSESEEEERFVQGLAQKYGCRIYTKRAPTLPPQVNQEAWARNFRYQFFSDVVNQSHAHYLATAHHQEDQAETLLARMFSGRAKTRIGTIQRLSSERKIVRPFLQVSKQAITDYRTRYSLSFREDTSNFDQRYQRNWLRHTILPLVKARINLSVASSLCDCAGRIEDDESYLWQEAEKYRREQQDILALPNVVGWRVLYLVAQQELGDRALALSYTSLQKCLCLLTQRPANRSYLELEDGICFALIKTNKMDYSFHFAIDKEKLRKSGALANTTDGTRGNLLAASPIHWAVDEDDLCMTIRETSRDDKESFDLILGKLADKKTMGSEMLSYFDADLLELGNLGLRFRKQGDRMDVFFRGQRKVKKLMQEHNIDQSRRDRIPLLVQENTVLWIPGVARSRYALVTNQTKRIFAISASYQPCFSK